MPKKILVVDDEKPISDIIKFNLAKEGFDVDTAYDGEEAVKKVDEYDPAHTLHRKKIYLSLGAVFNPTRSPKHSPCRSAVRRSETFTSKTFLFHTP